MAKGHIAPNLNAISDFNTRQTINALLQRIEQLESQSPEQHRGTKVTLRGIEKRVLTTQNLVSNNLYNKTSLNKDLVDGVNGIVAQAGPDFRLNVDNDNASIAFAHKDVSSGDFTDFANVTGIPAGAAYRPGMVLTAGGIGMGYADADGTWVNSVAIDAQGNASFSGEVNASSGNFTESITVGGTTLGAIRSNASAGAAHAGHSIYSTNNLMGDLQQGYDQVIGDSTFDQQSNGILIGTEANGVRISKDGIAAKVGDTSTFALTADGTATFSGELNAAGGNFVGNMTAGAISGVSVSAATAFNAVGVKIETVDVKTTVLGTNGGAHTSGTWWSAGIVGMNTNLDGSYTCGVAGECTASPTGDNKRESIGVYGKAYGYGGLFANKTTAADPVSCAAVVAQNVLGGTALRVSGPSSFDGDLIPSTHYEYDLGSATNRFYNAYVGTLYSYWNQGTGFVFGLSNDANPGNGMSMSNNHNGLTLSGVAGNQGTGPYINFWFSSSIRGYIDSTGAYFS